jgi:hypothetical protein
MNGENEGERRGKNGLNEMRLIYIKLCAILGSFRMEIR